MFVTLFTRSFPGRVVHVQVISLPIEGVFCPQDGPSMARFRFHNEYVLHNNE